MKVRFDEVRSSDRGFRVDDEIVTKERSASVRKKLGKFSHVEKGKKRADRASLWNTIIAISLDVWPKILTLSVQSLRKLEIDLCSKADAFICNSS